MSLIAHRKWKSGLVQEVVGIYGTPALINTFESIVRDDLGVDTGDVVAAGTYRLRVRSLVDAADRKKRLTDLAEFLRTRHGNKISPPPTAGRASRGASMVCPRTLAIECDRERQWLEVEPLLSGGFGTIIVPGPSGEGHEYFLHRVANAVETSKKLDLDGYDLSSERDCLEMLAPVVEATPDRDSVVDRLAAMTADGVTTLLGSKSYHRDDREGLHSFYVDFLPALLLEVRARAGIHLKREGRGVLFVHAIIRSSSVLDRDWLPRFILPVPRFLRGLRSTFLRRWHRDDLHFHLGRELLRISDEEALGHLEHHSIPIGDELKQKLLRSSASKAILQVMEDAARDFVEATDGGGRPGS